MGQMAFHFAKIDPNRFHQNRTDSGVMSIPPLVQQVLDIPRRQRLADVHHQG
jgi:hypothetical protein